MIRFGSADDSGDSPHRFEVTDKDQVRAGKWFERALEFGTLRKYDSAIEYYVHGLEFNPEAVEQGLKPLHGCAVAFRQSGGKKPGLGDTMKRSMTAKDAKQAFLNSVWLFGHDPENAAYAEGILKNANRLHADTTLMWAAGTFRRLLDGEKKPNVKRYLLLKQVLEECADRALTRSEQDMAIEALEMGVNALTALSHKIPKDRQLEQSIRDLTSKMTMVRGRYEDADTFRESIQDKEAQKDLHDEQRLIQADDRQDDLIAKARQAHEAHPDHLPALNKLVDLLCRRERESDEIEAIGLLVKHYQRAKEYPAKQKADDIRIRQLRRAVRDQQAASDAEKTATAKHDLLKYELMVYADRVKQYPTDLRFKYEYGVRLFQAGRIDEAIPILQAARADPKIRSQCSLYLGRAFYKKKYFTQGVSTLAQAVEEKEIVEDDTGKELYYWLGRSQEAAGKAEEARATYGELLQLDYNYRDVRERLEKLGG